MSRAKLRRMTAAEFDAVRPLLKNVSDDRAAVAREALVDGDTLAVVAERHDCSRQAVNKAVGTFWNRLTEYHEAQRATAHAGLLVPPGWEVVTLVAPSALVAKFRAEIALAAVTSPDEQKTAAA